MKQLIPLTSSGTCTPTAIVRTARSIAFLTVLCAVQSQAGITAVSDTFGDNTQTFPSWAAVAGAPVIGYRNNTQILNDYDRYDQINSQANPLDGDGIVGNLLGDTEATGDGLLNDGGFRMRPQDTIVQNEAIGFTLGGTMALGEQYDLTMGLENEGLSYFRGWLELYNLTDSSVLAATPEFTVVGNTQTTPPTTRRLQ